MFHIAKLFVTCLARGPDVVVPMHTETRACDRKRSLFVDGRLSRDWDFQNLVVLEKAEPTISGLKNQ
jgi:hypothetical protein